MEIRKEFEERGRVLEAEIRFDIEGDLCSKVLLSM